MVFVVQHIKKMKMQNDVVDYEVVRKMDFEKGTRVYGGIVTKQCKHCGFEYRDNAGCITPCPKCGKTFMDKGA